jgi:hypothetical protein
MRKLIFLIVASMLFSCKKETSVPMESNFDISINEIGYGYLEVKAGKLARLQDGKEKVAHFELSLKERKKIFGVITENDLFELPEIYEPKNECSGVPIIWTNIIITNGIKIVKINISDCDYGFFEQAKIKKIRSSVRLIKSIIDKKKEVKELPEPNLFML